MSRGNRLQSMLWSMFLTEPLFLSDCGSYTDEYIGGTWEEFRKSDAGKKASGPTGGIQGFIGTLFGYPYKPGGLIDWLMEIYGGPHDLFGGEITGLYDAEGNIRRGMGPFEKGFYDYVVSPAAIPVATPFAASMMPSQVWDTLSTLLKATK